MPFGPALPKGVRTPSTKTTSRSERDMGPPQRIGAGRDGAAPMKLPAGNRGSKRGTSPGGGSPPASRSRDLVRARASYRARCRDLDGDGPPSGAVERVGEQVAGELDLPLAGTAGPQRGGHGLGVPR